MARLPQFTAEKDRVRIRGFSQRVRALASEVDIRHVVSALEFAHLDPMGREFTDIGNWQQAFDDITVRLDRQANTTGGAANLQIQVNNAALTGVRLTKLEGTTIAQVLVPAEVFRAARDYREQSVRAHLVNVVRSALLQSSNAAGWQFTVAGG